MARQPAYLEAQGEVEGRRRQRQMEMWQKIQAGLEGAQVAAAGSPELKHTLGQEQQSEENAFFGRVPTSRGIVYTPTGTADVDTLSSGQRARMIIGELGKGGAQIPEYIDPKTGAVGGRPAGGGNYWDQLIGAAASGTPNLPAWDLPEAHSMIGNAGGDAAGQIAEARTAAGPNPLEDYISPTYKAEHPWWGDVQEGRYQDYQTQAGKELAGITGFDQPYDPTSDGREQRQIQRSGLTPDEIARRKAWLDQMRAFHGGA